MIDLERKGFLVYNEIKECSINWKGVYADVFFDNVNIEKKDTQLFYNELLSFRDIYKDIIIEYQKYGNNLFFELDDGIFTKIDDYSKDLTLLINKYSDLDSFYDLDGYSYLKKHKNILIKNRNKIKQIKEKYREIYNDVKENEDKIKKMLNNYEISSVNIKDRKIFSNNNKIYMETDKIDCSIKKLRYFVQEEDLILGNLKLLFVNKYYDSINSIKLEEILMKLINKYDVINKFHKENIKILVDSKEKYEQAERLLKNFEW